MGQIQNAISGAVSTAVGAQVAGELKTQREIGSVVKDLNTYASEIDKHNINQKKITEQANDTFMDIYFTKAGNERKKIDTEKEQAYNEWAMKASEELHKNEEMLAGWQTNLLKRVNALKKKGVESIDFDLARKTANTAQDNLFKRGGNQ